MMRNVVSLVLGGGRGTRLYPLTKYRAKPAVPLAAKYRLIDIPLSNCIHSGINQVYVLTQFMSVSLHRHIRQTYRFDRFNDGFVELLAAQETFEKGADWYQGTADAVRKNLRYLKEPGIDYVLILSGDQLYRMDYQQMLETHRSTGADATLAALPVDQEAAKAFGIMRLSDDGRVRGFVEKPQTPGEADPVRMDSEWIDSHGVESKGRDLLASMGIYMFNRDALVELLENTEHQDFGHELFPYMLDKYHVQMHMFDGYWEDIGTVRAFYESNLSLANPNPPFELASSEAPIYTRARFLPPALIEGAEIKNSLISDGCHIGKGAVVENSIVGLRCLVGENVTIRNSVVMGADFYEGDRDRAAHLGEPPIGIGAGSQVDGAIVDKNCRIGENVRIVNSNGVEESENLESKDTCVIRDGIPVVVKGAVLPNGFQL